MFKEFKFCFKVTFTCGMTLRGLSQTQKFKEKKIKIRLMSCY